MNKYHPKLVLYPTADTLRAAGVAGKASAAASSTLIVAHHFDSVNLGDILPVSLCVESRDHPEA